MATFTFLHWHFHCLLRKRFDGTRIVNYSYANNVENIWFVTNFVRLPKGIEFWSYRLGWVKKPTAEDFSNSKTHNSSKNPVNRLCDKLNEGQVSLSLSLHRCPARAYFWHMRYWNAINCCQLAETKEPKSMICDASQAVAFLLFPLQSFSLHLDLTLLNVHLCYFNLVKETTV